jgi:bifunctional polynucleotide phosphatase/kinase
MKKSALRKLMTTPSVLESPARRPNLVVLVGIPGAGKTTVTRALFSSHESVAMDKLPDRSRNAVDKMMMRLCAGGKDIVVDAANIDRITRMRFVRFAKDYGYDAHALFIDTSLDAALARNEGRSRKVPEGAIRSYCSKLEVPTEAEGFKTVLTVWNDWDPRR